MAKTLIYSDIHVHYKLLIKFLDKYEKDFDNIVLLGDYFDDFGDDVYINEETAQLLKDRFLYNDKYICLIGNHDCNYRFNNKYTWCSGFTIEKWRGINDILTKEDWGRFKDFAYIDGWLISHAGFNPHIFEFLNDGFNEKILTKFLSGERNKISQGQPAIAYGVGYSRGGSQKYGGFTWQDFNNECIPLKKIRQIVGHTIQSEPQVKFFGKSNFLEQRTFSNFNDWDHQEIVLCVDTKNMHYAILDNGKISIHKNELHEYWDESKRANKIFNDFKQVRNILDALDKTNNKPNR